MSATTGPVPDVPKLLDAVREDLAQMARVKGARFPSIGGAFDVLSLPGTWAVLLYRLASTAHHHKGMRPLSRLIFFVNYVLFGLEIQPGAIIQPGLVVPHPAGAGIATGTRMGKRVMMLKTVSVGGSGNPRRPGHPVIGDDVVLMDSCKVFGPVHIGDRCILGANAIVDKDLEPDMFVFASREPPVVKPLASLGLEGHAEAHALR
jgi:serine O-acetyltransferase